MDKRKEIFESIKDGITLEDKPLLLKWNSDLKTLLTDTINNHVDDNYIFLNFGDCTIFGGFEIKLSTSQSRDKGDLLFELGGALNNNEEAKSLICKFERVIGKPDYFSETYGESYAYWEDENSRIEIYPRHHMGGEWFEYRIKTKCS
jgi:hypothetical protein